MLSAGFASEHRLFSESNHFSLSGHIQEHKAVADVSSNIIAYNCTHISSNETVNDKSAHIFHLKIVTVFKKYLTFLAKLSLFILPILPKLPSIIK